MIPMGVPAPGPVGADAQRAEIGRCGETILIVDDEVPILKMSEKIMKKAGYTVIAVSNPVEAVEIVRRHGKEIALVLLDMIMPEMDGKDVYFAIREIAPDMKFLLCSGYAPDAKIRAFIKDKGVGFVQKPFSTHTLYDALRNVLDGS
jgi:DNA-binding NtrC family response regulator